MVITAVIVLLSLICLLRTLGLGVWCFKNKNFSGAISLFLLLIVQTGSALILLQR